MGADHSARVVMNLIDRRELADLSKRGKWDRLSTRLAHAGRALRKIGAQILLIDSSTLYPAARRVAGIAGITFVDIIDVVAAELKADDVRCVGLFGARCAAEERIWSDGLSERANIDVVLPWKGDREAITNIMDSQLALGRLEEHSYVTAIRIVKALKRQRVQRIIAVAPELSLLNQFGDLAVPLLETAPLHVNAALERACPKNCRYHG